MLGTDTTTASGRPQRSATGRKAEIKSTPRLRTGTQRLTTAIAAVTKTTAPALASRPTRSSPRFFMGATVDQATRKTRAARAAPSSAVNRDDQRDDQDRD